MLIANNRVLRASASTLAVAAGLMISGAACAQASTDDQGIPDIVVTAQKRSENINNVGMSITAKTGDDLVAHSVRSLDDFSKIEPSFTYGETLSGTPTFTVRGVGYYNYALASPPAVSVYTDEVPYAYSAMAKGVALDVERVEILKGPQGTLFGQNSTGGAVNFIAAKPTATFEAGLDASYARFGATNLNGYVSGPVSDTLRFRLAFNVDSGGAWQQSYTRDQALGDRRFENARLLAEWKPAAGLTINLNVSGWRDRSDTQAGQYVGLPTTYPTLDANPAVKAALQAYPRAPSNARAADWDAGLNVRAREDFFQASVRIDYDIAPAVRLTSLTAYSDFENKGSEYVLDGINPTNFGLKSFGHVHSFSQELRLSGRAFQSKLDWLVGLNYASDRVQDIQLLDFTNNAAATGFGAPITGVRNEANPDTVTKAAFANLKYALTDTLSLNAGARYTDPRTKFSGCTYDNGDGTWAAGINGLQSLFKNVLHASSAPFVAVPPGGCTTLDATITPAIYAASLSQKNTSWRAGLDWKAGPHALLYANVTKGYKSGAFPTQTAISSRQSAPTVQESVLAYEAGFKTLWFGRALQLNGAYFHYDYRNKQIQGNIDNIPVFGVLSALINVPKSALDGFEISSVLKPVAGLTLDASGTYLNARVTDHYINVIKSGANVDFKGLAFPFTPKWSFQLGLNYETSVSPALNAYVGGDYSHRSSTSSGFGGLDFERIKGYGLLDLRLGLRSKDNRWHAEVFGKNVTNTYYWHTADQDGDTLFRLAGQPATYGVRLGYKFR